MFLKHVFKTRVPWIYRIILNTFSKNIFPNNILKNLRKSTMFKNNFKNPSELGDINYFVKCVG